MNDTLTVSAWQRPDLLQQCLESLARCAHVAFYDVTVFVDHGPKQDECMHVAKSAGFDGIALDSHVGCNAMIQRCMNHGFKNGQRFHIHLEDDIVPERGFLAFMEWARDQYAKGLGVLSVTGYNRLSEGAVNESSTYPEFTPWGWGTWIDRWSEINSEWHKIPVKCTWDTYINRHLLKGRKQAYPSISRVQNIGSDRAAHTPSADFHHKFQHSRRTARDVVYKFDVVNSASHVPWTMEVPFL